MSKSHYKSLDAAKREFRVLKIAAADQQDRLKKLELSATVQRIGDETHYWALSYTWGKPVPTFTVSLNGIDFDVQQNLYEALQHFRPLTGSVTIWVDAICINQADTAEREAQVAMMRDIYAGAAMVYAWLGPGHNSTQTRKAFVLMSELAEREMSDGKIDSVYFINSRRETRDWVAERLSTTQEVEAWLAMADVLDSPWFCRMWIIQEIVMAKDILVVCGDVAASWDEVVYLAGKFLEKYTGTFILKEVGDTSVSALRKVLRTKYAAIQEAARSISEIGRARNVRRDVPLLPAEEVSMTRHL